MSGKQIALFQVKLVQMNTEQVKDRQGYQKLIAIVLFNGPIQVHLEFLSFVIQEL